MSKQESYTQISSNKNLKTIFLILFFAVLFVMIFIYRYYFWPFIFALVFYISFKPIHEFLLKYLRFRLLSTNVLLVSFLCLIVVPFFFLSVSLANQTYEFYIYIANQVDLNETEVYLRNNKLVVEILKYFNISEREIIQKIVQNLQQTSLTVFSRLTNIVTFSIKFSVNFLFMLLIMFFFFSEGEKISLAIYNIMPFPDDIEKDIIDRLKNVIKVLVAGNLLIMIMQGTMVGLGFYISKLPIPLLAGSIAAIFSLIPVIGTSFVFVPAVIYLLITGEYTYASFLLIWCFSWYLFLENVVKPKVFGKRLNFHPLVFFFLLIGSIQTFNLPGVIVGPLLLTLFYSLWEIYKILDVYGLKKDDQNKEKCDLPSTE